MKEVLQFENVSMHYHSKQGETVAVQDMNFSVYEREFVAIIGPSGCGKTTLLSMAAGLLPPTKGKVISGGCSFGYMLQKDELFPWRSIEKNIFLPLEIKKTSTPETRANALALAEKYGLPIKPTQVIHPWMFGDNYSKTTCLWLKGLPNLIPEVTEEPEMEYKEWVTKDGKKKRQNKWYYDALINCTPEERAKVRSKTFEGVARAIAEQYGK